MKTLKKFLVGLFALAMIAIFGFLLSQRPSNVKANPSRFEHTRTATATSSLVSATTTLTILTNGADRADMELIAKASTSALSLTWTYEYSHNGIDWFGEDYLFSQSNTTSLHSTSSPTHIWQGASGWATAASTSSRSVLNIPLPGYEYMRVKFVPTTSNALIWADVVTKIQDIN